jgi:EAL domain-containing protein (putative c-di-GMP-specific phosphodiesterase class I)
MASLLSSPCIHWQLLECAPAGQPARVVSINANPFSIGRSPETSLSLANPSVSKLHAELVYQDNVLWVRDLQSTNGTFINGRRVVDPVRLAHDDLLQVSNEVFRVQQKKHHDNAQTHQGDAFAQVQALCQFDRLMSERAVIPHFQPIVSLNSGTALGYESLARSALEGLQSPADMFAAAARLDQEIPLSEMLRMEGLRRGLSLAGRPAFFINTHPLEVATKRFLGSLEEVQAIAPGQLIVIEVHEAAVTDPQAMGKLLERIRALGMQLAYDDFGAGQARLDELSEFPPDYVKFDIKLIRNIHDATPHRRHMIEQLVAMVRQLGATPLAEGIELCEEADTCRELGFELAQGYFFGRPQPLSVLQPTFADDHGPRA